jgi:hypothetical protein
MIIVTFDCSDLDCSLCLQTLEHCADSLQAVGLEYPAGLDLAEKRELIISAAPFSSGIWVAKRIDGISHTEEIAENFSRPSISSFYLHFLLTHYSVAEPAWVYWRTVMGSSVSTTVR